MIYLKLEMFEMESQFVLFAAVSDNEKQKDHRIATRISVFGGASELITALRSMADELERKFE